MKLSEAIEAGIATNQSGSIPLEVVCTAVPGIPDQRRYAVHRLDGAGKLRTLCTSAELSEIEAYLARKTDADPEAWHGLVVSD